MNGHPHFLWRDIFKRQADDEASLREALHQNVLFRTLNKRELNYLTNVVYERIYQPDEVVFKQNDRGLGMYFIRKGQVAIKSLGGGSEIHITTLSEGSFFGELALVDPDNIRTATAVALEKTVLIGFFKPDLMEILERKPEMGVKVLLQLSTVLGRRLLETTERVTLLARARGVSQGHEEIL